MSKSDKYSPPSRECPIGERIAVRGVVYRCVERPRIVCCRDACSGCDFSRMYRCCDSVRCSAFDRSDGRFVWYIEEA